VDETHALSEKIQASISQNNIVQGDILQNIARHRKFEARLYDLVKELKCHQDEVLAEIRYVKQLSAEHQVSLSAATPRASCSSSTDPYQSLRRSSGSHTDEDRATGSLALDDINSIAPFTAFETSSSFFPEQYTVKAQLSSLEAGYTSKKTFGLRTGSMYKVCMIYAERPRTWRRLTLSFFQKPDGAQVAQVARLILSADIPFFEGVTNISQISINGQSNLLDEQLLRSSEDEDELNWDRASSFASQMDDLGCTQFLESEVVAIAAINGHNYYSLVQGERYIERKLTFAMDGNDRFSDFYGGFFSNIRSLHILRFSKGVVQLKGVVLDDKRYRVKSYLIAGGELGTIGNILRKCNQHGINIPWSVRENWAREMVTAMVDIHSQNLVVGRLGLWSLVLDKDGHVRRKNVDGNVCLEHGGWAAPEAKFNALTNDKATRDKMCAKTDLFQLGLELWLLANQEPGYGIDLSKRWCQDAKCSFDWRESGSRCRATHSDPIELSPCSGDVPAWYQAIIDVCRSTRGEERSAARKLLEMFPRKVRNDSGWTQRFAAWPVTEITAHQVEILKQSSCWRPRGLTASD
jgi:hypothetical protein